MVLLVDTIVFYLFSTSNHNRNPKEEYHLILSFISFLHQTTTPRGYPHVIQHCLLSLFYIKPQRVPVSPITRLNCLLSLFYIKPQPVDPLTLASSIVFYLFSTSNHNGEGRQTRYVVLSFISFLHQTTTRSS